MVCGTTFLWPRRRPRRTRRFARLSVKATGVRQAGCTTMMKPGDIIGFSSYGWVGFGVNLATYGVPFWSISHVGIVGEHNGELLLFESTTLNNLPCVIRGHSIKGTQAQRLDTRLLSYRGKAYHYPLYRRLYDFERERLHEFLMDSLGVPYDDVGAFRAGGTGWSWFESLMRGESMCSLFCSEFVCAAHREIGVFPTDNVSRWSPNKFVRTERKREILLKPRRLK